MITRCKEFSNKRVITLHGRKFSKEPIKSFYSSYIEFYHCLSHQKRDALIHFGGTGVMCFHTSLMKIPITYFEHPNMADVWIGKYCFENNIEVLSIAHTKNFLTYQPQKTTIFDSESNSDTIQTKIVNDLFNPNKQVVNVVTEKPIKITQTIEKSVKTINYDKVNQIFNNTPSHRAVKPKTITGNSTLKTNASMINKLVLSKKKR